MKSPRRTLPFRLLATLLLIPAFLIPAGAQVRTDVEVAAVDAIFEAFESTRTPGCAVGVSLKGEVILSRAYGMADLEHNVPNTPGTIFEPGSVSKQFTATATILLALEGKLSLDDDIRLYLPELPDYGEPVTVRHLLNHTSGLRDWGSVAGIEGWPRTRRAHTHTHVLDILSRQEALNYPTGEYYSYTNSGYNLQAILVERVSGIPFAEFSRTQIFEPLGMTDTQWRDDFTRIVKDRAMAYRRGRDGSWSTLMPFEDVHGNGGLLTTVEDLLKFTWNLQTGELWGPRYVEEMHHQGVLNSGEVISYASGLQVGAYKGVPEVQHSGSTAGYRGHLSRFPDQDLGVAVVCNASSANAGGLLHQVADLYLDHALQNAAPAPPAGSMELPGQRLEALAGDYRDARTGTPVRVVAVEGGLRVGGATMVPVSVTRFEGPGGRWVLEFERAPSAHGRPAAIYDSPGQPGVRIEPVPAFEPTAGELEEYAGTYRSHEAEATYTVQVAGESLLLKDRWGDTLPLRPLYPDAFARGGTTLVFHRDSTGTVGEMSWSESRVWDLRFRKIR